MSEFITLGIEFLKTSILPLFDFMYIGIVISGSTLLFQLVPILEKTKRRKFMSVFFFASVISLAYAYLHKDLEGFSYVIGRNFFNYSLAILIYHSVIKTISKAWENFWNKYLGE